MIDLYFEIRKRICPFDIVLKNIPTQQKILDIGCGNGIIYKYYLKKLKYISYTGIDNNKKSIIKLNNLKTKKAIFLNKDVKEITNDIAKYDCILMIDIMHHLKINQQKKIIENILLKMKNGSTLIYKDISNRNFIKSLINRFHDLIFNFQFINYYDSKKIINFARKQLNIKDIKEFNIDLFWYEHEFLIIHK